jgi:Trypsin-like peptidase domain
MTRIVVTARSSWLCVMPAVATGAVLLAQQNGPTFPTRDHVLKSLVYIRASECPDPPGGARVGSGFAVGSSGSVVTAHHVVGGCKTITITYEGIAVSASRVRSASIARVLSTGDLALLTVTDPPGVPALAVANPPYDKGATYAGFGYQNGQPSAGDQQVTFSTGSSYLRDILPREAASALQRANSHINMNGEVLRFNVALQPGMSGGPIVNSAGEVVGIVAGGLKAGAAPASWGWPAEWISQLRASNDARDQPVSLADAYYTLTDMAVEAEAVKSGRKIVCGSLTFAFHGQRGFLDVARGADDEARLNYLKGLSTLPMSTIESMRFDTWVHEPSGATVVTPAGYSQASVKDACEFRSTAGPFVEVVWGASAADATEVTLTATRFEQTVMLPRVPYQFGYQVDQALTISTPQFRDNGLLFNRKGFYVAKEPPVAGVPLPVAHTFEALIAKNGTFVGVGIVNDDVPAAMTLCTQSGGRMQGCEAVMRHLEEWTRFILATQLSTYPST